MSPWYRVPLVPAILREPQGIIPRTMPYIFYWKFDRMNPLKGKELRDLRYLIRPRADGRDAANALRSGQQVYYTWEGPIEKNLREAEWGSPRQIENLDDDADLEAPAAHPDEPRNDYPLNVPALAMYAPTVEGGISPEAYYAILASCGIAAINSNNAASEPKPPTSWRPLTPTVPVKYMMFTNSPLSDDECLDMVGSSLANAVHQDEPAYQAAPTTVADDEYEEGISARAKCPSPFDHQPGPNTAFAASPPMPPRVDIPVYPPIPTREPPPVPRSPSTSTSSVVVSMPQTLRGALNDPRVAAAIASLQEVFREYEQVVSSPPPVPPVPTDVRPAPPETARKPSPPPMTTRISPVIEQPL